MDKLLLDLQDGLATVTINRISARNALDLEIMHTFANMVEELHAMPDLRAVVITGAGNEAFCSGADLHELAHYPTAEDARHMVTIMGDALLRLERLPVPVIAGINGYALGGGAELAMACDVRIADERARMGFIHARLGVTPGWGAGQRLMRLVGYARALDLFLSSRIMHADELFNYGLVTRLVPFGTAQEHAVNYARHVCTFAPDVICGMKAVLQAGLVQSYDGALANERDHFPPLWAGQAHQDAVVAFLRRHKA